LDSDRLKNREGGGMDDQIARLFALVAAVAAGYGQLFGRYQFQIVEWVVAAGSIDGRYRGVVNLIVGVTLAGTFSGLAAWQIDDWGIVIVGLLAGVLASVEAAKVHDAKGP
jgi:hypothetical protein